MEALRIHLANSSAKLEHLQALHKASSDEQASARRRYDMFMSSVLAKWQEATVDLPEIETEILYVVTTFVPAAFAV